MVWIGVSATGCAARAARVASPGLECPKGVCPSFASLLDSNALHPGGLVRVLDTGGKRLTGTLVGLTPTEIFVQANDGQVQMAEADVLGIWRRASRGRSMAGYGAIGAALGLGWGSIAWMSKRHVDCTRERADLSGDCYVHERDYFVVPAMSLAIIGAGYGMFRRGERQVFTAATQPAIVLVRPQVGRTRAGVHVAVRF